MIMKKVFLFISTFPISLPAESKTNFNRENTSIVGKLMFFMMMMVYCISEAATYMENVCTHVLIETLLYVHICSTAVHKYISAKT